MEPDDDILREILENQRRLMAAMDHALAGHDATDKGPRRGWLRGMISDLDRLADVLHHPLVVALRRGTPSDA